MLWVFYPLFPLQTIPWTSGNKWNAIWSLSNITVYTFSRCEAPEHLSVSAAVPERAEHFSEEITCAVVWKMFWQLIGWTLLFLLLLLFFLSDEVFLFLWFPVYLNGSISPFQTGKLVFMFRTEFELQSAFQHQGSDAEITRPHKNHAYAISHS